MIKVLDQETINKIAAGEVVERPSSVVKELVENSIDSGATAITVEIKEGGLSLIRVTDNGQGIHKNEVPVAFIRHATSKIITIEDLLTIESLGFRGEALASISAVSQVECITKYEHDLTGIRYVVHGSQEISSEEIGAPTGTTIIIRNLFYNVPARKKFLKSSTTEASYITDLIIKLAISKPEISFKYIINGTNKISTSGNGKLMDVIYHIYGKEVSSNLLPVKREIGEFKVEGYIGKSYISKGNRSFEHYFINDRAIKSLIVTKAIEEAYKSFVMIHKFPFTALHFTLNSNKLDVNVHPTKMEFKYADSEELFHFVKESVRYALLQEEMIPDISLRSNKEQKQITIEHQKSINANIPEPFEKNQRALRYQQEFNKKETREIKNNVKPNHQSVNDDNKIKEQNIRYNQKNIKPIDSLVKKSDQVHQSIQRNIATESIPKNVLHDKEVESLRNHVKYSEEIEINANIIQKNDMQKSEQFSLPVEQFISKEARKKHKLIGQIFLTYWIVEYNNQLYIIDQHAAHEKVMFERLMNKMSSKQLISQHLLPPKMIQLSPSEHLIVINNKELFNQTGFELEDFGNNSIIIRSMPDDIMGIDPQLLFDELLNVLNKELGHIDLNFFVEKISTMACKAAIKGNTKISVEEADSLIDELLTLDNPYNCPHGRPTIITITEKELEKKFKRIQN